MTMTAPAARNASNQEGWHAALAGLPRSAPMRTPDMEAWLRGYDRAVSHLEARFWAGDASAA